MKKKLLLFSMIACILAVALVGGSLAYASTVTNNNSITTTINTPQLDVQLLPQQEASGSSSKAKKENVPGAVVPLNYSVLNPEASGTAEGNNGTKVATSNQTEYICLTIDKSWKQAGEKQADADVGKFTLNFVNTVKAADLTSAAANAGTWIILRETDEQVMLVYSLPVKPGTELPYLASLTLGTDLRGVADFDASVDVTAQAVQYAAGANEAGGINAGGILSAWGAAATLDSGTGAITGISY